MNQEWTSDIWRDREGNVNLTHVLVLLGIFTQSQYVSVLTDLQLLELTYIKKERTEDLNMIT